MTTTKEMTKAELQAEVERLRAASKNGGTLSAKVSQKGAVSIYGLQRMPVTLYAAQWERLLTFGPTIAKFIETNKGALSYK